MGDNEQKSNKSFTYEDKSSKNEEILEDKKEKEKINKIENSKMIDDYIIKNTIGKGTFSTVKLGEHIKTKQKVAIKILNKEKLKEKEDSERIKREIKILQMMDHPNIIKTYKISENSKNYYIIMEYCNGGELFNYIVEKEKLDENEASMFFYQLISALEYIHSLGITHRDLKPENLLLVNNKIIKIIDFGLSNYFNGEKQLETPCGSPSYASPEIIKGEAYNGFNIDIWASGIILFAMLCGYLPFDDDEEEEDDDDEEGNRSVEDNIKRKSSNDVSSDDSEDNEVLFQRILEGKLEYPSHLSANAVDLMKKILVVDPNKRIQIKDIKKHNFFLLGKKNFLLNQKNIMQHQTSKDENSNDKKKTNKFNKSIDYVTNENKENSVNNSSPSEAKNDSNLCEEEDNKDFINKIIIKSKEELKNEMEEYEKKLFENYLRKVIDLKKNNQSFRKKNKQKNGRYYNNKNNIYSNDLNTINVNPNISSINKSIKKYGRNNNNNYTLNQIILNFEPNHME